MIFPGGESGFAFSLSHSLILIELTGVLTVQVESWGTVEEEGVTAIANSILIQRLEIEVQAPVRPRFKQMEEMDG